MTFIIPGFLNAYFGATVDPIMRLIAGV